jgi:hypothetical protein
LISAVNAIFALSLSVRFLYYNTISLFIKNNKFFIIETILIFIQPIKLLFNQWISSKYISFPWKSYVYFSRRKILHLYTSILQFYLEHKYFVPVTKLSCQNTNCILWKACNHSCSAYSFSHLHIHFNNFQNNGYFSSTPDGVETLFFFRRRKPSFQHLLNL